jgi:hypothetical protein
MKRGTKALQLMHCVPNDDATECWITHTNCVNTRLVPEWWNAPPPPVQVATFYIYAVHLLSILLIYFCFLSFLSMFPLNPLSFFLFFVLQPF